MFYIIFPLAIIAFMCYCIMKGENFIGKIVATIFLCAAAINLLSVMHLLPESMYEHMNFNMRLFTLGTALFIFQLFRTASEVKIRGEEGANYNYILGVSLIVMLVFSFQQYISFLESEWFYSFRVRVWPEIAVLTTIIVMKVRKIVLNKDEDRLLWYFAASCLLMLSYYFF